MTRPRWSLPLEYSLRGLSLARDTNRLLAWDDQQWLFWTNDHGQRQAQVHLPNPILSACISEEGSVIASAEADGRICLLEKGDWLWRDTPVTHVGGMAVAGIGEPLLFAVFSEGIRGYCKRGQLWKPKVADSSCRMVSVSYDGSLILAIGMDGTLAGFTAQGTPRFTHRLPTAPIAMAIDAWGSVVYVALASKELTALEIQ